MATANYFGTLFKSNGVASAATAPTRFDSTLPHLERRGIPSKVTGSIAFTAALATTDVLYLARVPANHRVIGMKFRFAEIDSGTTVTVNLGTQADGTTWDDADAFAAASTSFRLAAVREFPGSTAAVALDAPTTWWTGPNAAGVPTVDYNIVMVLAAGPSTATSGTIYYEIEYMADVAVMDDYNSPAVVAGTQ